METESQSETTFVKMKFKISGEFIIDHVRERFREDGFNEAIRFLRESIEGLSIEDAIEICKGKKKMCGLYPDEELVLLEDNDEETFAYFKYKFRGLLKIRGNYYQPYAYVSNVGPYDFNAMGVADSPYIRHRDPRAQNFSILQWPSGRSDMGRKRSSYYLDDPSSDIQFPLPVTSRDGFTINRAVFFKRVENIFFDCDYSISPAEALIDYIKCGGSLKETGHTTCFLDFNPFSPSEIKSHGSIKIDQMQLEMDKEVNKVNEPPFVLGGSIKDVPKPHLYFFPSDIRSRQLKVSALRFPYVGTHYYVTVEEEDNYVLDKSDKENIVWRFCSNDKKCQGKSFEKKCNTPQAADDYIKRMIKKFPKHKISIGNIEAEIPFVYQKVGD